MIEETSSVSLREQCLASAADWVLRLRDPSVSPTDISAWTAWCDASAENQQAFDEMQQLCQDAQLIEAQPIQSAELARDGYLGQVSIAEWRQASRRPTRNVLEILRQRRARVAVAAGLLLGVSFLLSLEWPNRSDIVVVTDIGRNERTRLPDGSLVIIAGGSRLATHYTGRERTVFLERGEAFFEVGKDPSRPFAVHALDSKVTALGTAFNVRAERGLLHVAVTEGSVEVGRHDDSGTQTLPTQTQHEGVWLRAGQQVTLSVQVESAPVVSPVDTQQATSWVSGTLRFVNEPLASVVAAVNRYSSQPIEIADRELEDYRYTGTVVASRVDEWLRGLPEAFPVVVSGARIALAPGESADAAAR